MPVSTELYTVPSADALHMQREAADIVKSIDGALKSDLHHIWRLQLAGVLPIYKKMKDKKLLSLTVSDFVQLSDFVSETPRAILTDELSTPTTPEFDAIKERARTFLDRHTAPVVQLHQQQEESKTEAAAIAQAFTDEIMDSNANNLMVWDTGLIFREIERNGISDISPESAQWLLEVKDSIRSETALETPHKEAIVSYLEKYTPVLQELAASKRERSGGESFHSASGH